MGEWKEVKFSDFVDINPAVKLNTTELYSFIEMKDLQENYKYCFPSSEKHPSGGARFKEGDTLFARITPCLENGKICKVKGLKNGVGFGSTEFFVFRGKENISDNDFIFYLARWDEVRSYAESHFEGTSGRQRVPKSCFDNLFLTIPPLPEQRAIASVLSSLDDKIDLLHHQNKTLEAMAEKLFRQWFVEPCKDGLPEGWEEKKLKEVVIFEKGRKPQETFELQITGLIPQILIETFDSGKVMFSKPEGMVIANEKDILVVMDGASSGRVETGYNGIVGSTIGLFRPKNGFSFPKFLYYFLKSKEDYIREYTTGSAIPHADKSLILDLLVSFPNIESIKRFEKFTENLFDKKILNNQQILTLEKLRDTLLPKLMNGEVRVEYE
jgi:type I restriction enzyme S subunit